MRFFQMVTSVHVSSVSFKGKKQPEVWRVLAKCHHQRNLAEYEGHLEIDNVLLNDLLLAADWLLERVLRLPAI